MSRVSLMRLADNYCLYGVFVSGLVLVRKIIMHPQLGHYLGHHHLCSNAAFGNQFYCYLISLDLGEKRS